MIKELIDELKAWLKDNQDNYVEHQMLGDTETGFYDQDEFDIDKLMEEIDEFVAFFEEKRKKH